MGVLGTSPTVLVQVKPRGCNSPACQLSGCSRSSETAGPNIPKARARAYAGRRGRVEGTCARAKAPAPPRAQHPAGAYGCQLRSAPGRRETHGRCWSATCTRWAGVHPPPAILVYAWLQTPATVEKEVPSGAAVARSRHECCASVGASTQRAGIAGAGASCCGGGLTGWPQCTCLVPVVHLVQAAFLRLATGSTPPGVACAPTHHRPGAHLLGAPRQSLAAPLLGSATPPARHEVQPAGPAVQAAGPGAA